MKVLLINGSPHAHGCTYTALSVVADELQKNGVENEIIHVGHKATLDQLNKCFAISEMPIASSRYWNMVHGFTPEDVMQDEEGCQIMRVLGRNVAFRGITGFDVLRIMETKSASGVRCAFL